MLDKFINFTLKKKSSKKKPKRERKEEKKTTSGLQKLGGSLLVISGSKDRWVAA